MTLTEPFPYLENEAQISTAISTGISSSRARSLGTIRKPDPEAWKHFFKNKGLSNGRPVRAVGKGVSDGKEGRFPILKTVMD